MKKLLLATALASSPAMADVPESCAPLRSVVEGFQQRFDEGILPMNLAPQMKAYYELAEASKDGATPEQLDRAHSVGQELGLKMSAMGLQPSRMRYVLENLHRAVEDCINRPEA